MTLTATPSTSTVDQAAFAGIADPSRESLLTTTDHRRVARLQLFFAFVFLVLGGVVGAVLRAELVDNEANQVLESGETAILSWSRLFSAHSTIMVLLVLAPLWVALGTLVVPRQLGSARLAFPRLQALSLWAYVVGGGMLIASYLVEDGPPAGLGITLGNPDPGTGNKATDLFFGSLMLLALAALLAAVNFFVSVLTQRAPGLSLSAVRPFTWSTFVTSAILLISTPVFLAGLLLTYLDLHFGGALYSFAGADRVWVHTVWLFGRPEAFLLMLPALGAASDIIVQRTGRALVGGPVASYLLALFGVLSLGSWAGDTYIASALVQPTSRWLTALVAVPVALLVLLWLGSLRFGARPDASLIFVIGFVALLALGAGNVIAAAFQDVAADDGGMSAWAVGHLHTVVFGAPLLAAFGAVAAWSPLAYGRRLVQALTGLSGLALLVGIGAMGMADYLLGYDGAPAHVAEYETNKWSGLNTVAGIGGIVAIAGAALFFLNLIVSVAARKGAAADDDLAPAPATGGAA